MKPVGRTPRESVAILRAQERKKFPRVNFAIQVFVWILGIAWIITNRSLSSRIEVGAAIAVTALFWVHFERRRRRGR